MTIPDERVRTVLHTKDFLEDLCSSETMPGVPDAVRQEARRLPRHYSSRMDLARASRFCPHIFDVEALDARESSVPAGR
jgi:hypothetical protein